MRNSWTRDDHIIAFNVYCRIPFGQIDEDTPEVQELAKLVGRSVGAASYKLANFARLDPALKKRGVLFASFPYHPCSVAGHSWNTLSRWY
jgi:putative restriction endonuclease